MAKIFLGIALAVMLATAALGFLAKSNADKMQTTLKAAKSSLATAESSQRKAVADLKARTDELTAATAKVEEKDKELATQKGAMDDLNKKIAEATTAMETKTGEVATLTKTLEEMKIAMGGKGAADGAANPAMDILKAEVARAQTSAAESEALVAALTQQKKNVEDKMVSLEQYKKSRELGITRQGLSGRILAVNSGWNFVVLSIGDKQGAQMNASMLVVRGGTPIGKVRITSVEPSTSIADVIPGSVLKGVTVQPGDNVVFEGRNSSVGAPQPPSGIPTPAR